MQHSCPLGEADTQHVTHSVRHFGPLSARTSAPGGKVRAAWSGPDIDATVGSMFPQPCAVLPVLPSVLYLAPAWSGICPKQNFRDIKDAGPQCVQAMSRMVQVLLRACWRAYVRVLHRRACVSVHVCVCVRAVRGHRFHTCYWCSKEPVRVCPTEI